MSYLLGCRSLWRKGAADCFAQSLLRTADRTCTRYISSWKEEVKEVGRDSKQPPLSGRVHILGTGNVGQFIAHGLASRLPRPPITLLFHRPEMIQNFRERKYSIDLEINGLDDNKTGFDVEVLDRYSGTWHSVSLSDDDKTPRKKNAHQEDSFLEDSRPVEDPIECLILSCKANVTYEALLNVKDRLTPDSTILLAQNGIGIIKMINEQLWPDPETRPNYMQAIISHGLTKITNFHVAHKGVGTIMLSPAVVPDVPLITETNEESDWAPSTKYLIRLLTLTPSLVANLESPAGLFQYQLEKLAVNCVINPLTALYQCRNGELLYIFNVTRMTRLLLFELSNVIYALPELQGIPGVEARFAPERLRRLVTATMMKTSNNLSSMHQDIKAHKPTEINYLNGWVVRRGEELGMKCVLNYMMKQLILAKGIIDQRAHGQVLPIDTSDFPNIELAEIEAKENEMEARLEDEATHIDSQIKDKGR